MVFSQLVTERIRSHPRITVEATEVTQVPQGPVIVATGPSPQMPCLRALPSILDSRNTCISSTLRLLS